MTVPPIDAPVTPAFALVSEDHGMKSRTGGDAPMTVPPVDAPITPAFAPVSEPTDR